MTGRNGRMYTARQNEIISDLYFQYLEGMDEKHWKYAIEATGLSKKKINKALWDITINLKMKKINK